MLWCLILLTALSHTPSKTLISLLGDRHFQVRRVAYYELSYRYEDHETTVLERAGEHDADPEIRHACRGLRWSDYEPPWSWEYVYTGNTYCGE